MHGVREGGGVASRVEAEARAVYMERPGTTSDMLASPPLAPRTPCPQQLRVAEAMRIIAEPRKMMTG